MEWDKPFSDKVNQDMHTSQLTEWDKPCTNEASCMAGSGNNISFSGILSTDKIDP